MFSLTIRVIFSLILFFVGFGFAKTEVSVSRTSEGGVFAPGDIIFEEEFNFLNTSLWQYEINMNGGYNSEFQIYSNYSENAYVRDGILYIRPSLTLDTVFGGDIEKLYNGNLSLPGCTDVPGLTCEREAVYPFIHPPITSARLRTKGAFSFTYGRIEFRAKLSSGDWTWPAVWLMPEDSVYGDWPRSGEIDIIEARGNRKLFNFDGTINLGCEQTSSTLNFGTALEFEPPWWTARGEYNTAPGEGFNEDFHVYETIWTPTYMHFKVDNVTVLNVVPPEGGFYELGNFPSDQPNPWVNATNPRMAPYDEAFHFILNVATGGAYFTYIETQPLPPWGETAFLDFFNIRDEWLSSWTGENHTMAIDYIRVFAI